jgi:predicted metalloprotease
VRERQSAASSQAEANDLSVRMELQADCFAGVWAATAQRSRQLLSAGDVDEALGAAAAIGDDRIQRQMQGHVVPDSFTHGSGEQRQRWFLQGFQAGSPDACDSFNTRTL